MLATSKPFPMGPHNIVELTPANWEEVVFNANYDVVVEFYSPYCGYCIDFIPTWNEIGDAFHKEDSVIIAKINIAIADHIKHPLISKYHIRGVPAIYLFPAKNKEKPIIYSSATRTAAQLTTWILASVDHSIEVNIVYKSQEKPANQLIVPGTTVPVVGLTWKDIVLDTSKTVFVNFYAPWCPYSQRLAPIWDEFAKAMADYPTVVIAKMDGTVNEVPGLQLYAFPTLTIYKSGDNAEVQYRGFTRSVEAFKTFLLETAGNLKTKKEIEALGITTGDEHKIEKKKKSIDEKSDEQKSHDKEEMNTFEVKSITDENIESEIINSPKNVVVLFYASWMDDKNEVLQKWKEIALEFRFVTAIKILQTEGDKYKKWDVNIFPTIKMFKAHSTGETPFEVTFKGQDLKIANVATWIRENAVKTKEDEQARTAPPSNRGSFEGYQSKETETVAKQSLLYREDL